MPETPTLPEPGEFTPPPVWDALPPWMLAAVAAELPRAVWVSYAHLSVPARVMEITVRVRVRCPADPALIAAAVAAERERCADLVEAAEPDGVLVYRPDPDAIAAAIRGDSGGGQ